MTDQQWEFCVLCLRGEEEKNGKWYCALAVRYFGKVGTYQRLSQSKQYGGRAWAYSPWDRAMTQLGGFGWELVSVQHADSGGYLYHESCVAYFKRPVKAGLRVDEPKLTLE